MIKAKHIKVATVVLTLSKDEEAGIYTINIIPEVCNSDEIGVTLNITEKEYEALNSLDFNQE